MIPWGHFGGDMHAYFIRQDLERHDCRRASFALVFFFQAPFGV